MDVERLREERGDPEHYRLEDGYAGEVTFEGWRLAVGRTEPVAAGVQNQVHLFATKSGEAVAGLRVGHVNAGPNGPIRSCEYRLVRRFDSLREAASWLEEDCPWEEARREALRETGTRVP